MSRPGKKAREEDGLSDGDEPQKKSLKSENDDDESDNIFICELSKNRKVSVRIWMGKVVVDIREFYIKDGKELPSKKGISLSLDQWKTLREHADEIDKELGDD
ncbi:RNA polymerase II transcriptional coactivator KIWI-like [Andrographis paniculata]|uniref:RNA polymerase II transcriptional coactivator KIWI-like n=1 Tax=Andrographis paniculata TaxID=175694 RepID=UPI0021E6F16B|nr:RNA polymerase II transcriptional coactivator KIWI-like [Andrographis paniculata]